MVLLIKNTINFYNLRWTELPSLIILFLSLIYIVYSLPIFSFSFGNFFTKVLLFSSAFAFWANAELYILGPSLTYFLSPFLPFSGRKLEISVKIDARTLIFSWGIPRKIL